jgi:hypothetical protein
MKLRNGFVSNSSGSSFMIGLAVVVDRQKFDAWVKRDGIKLDKFDVAVEDFDELVSRGPNSDYPNVQDGKIVLEAFDEVTKVSLPFDAIFNVDVNKPVDKEAKRLLAGHEGEIFVVNITNNEGDSLFWKEDEYDFYIDVDFFGGWQRKLWDGMTEENGLASVNKAFGAGRNG